METITLVTGCILAAGIAIVAARLRWLTPAGAVVAGLMGVVIWGIGGLFLATPMLVFFISGSVLSKILKASNQVGEKDKKPRDHIQVLCNGGLAVACLFIFYILQKPVWIVAYFLSISICNADTWSSEIGTRFGKHPVDILTMRKMIAGQSGGISFIGTLSGLVGAALIGANYWLMADVKPGWDILVIVLGGFAGMLVDSMIGSAWQAVYQLQDGRQVEYDPTRQTAVLKKGYRWMTNDLVNLLSNIIVTGLGILVLEWAFS